MDVIEDKCTCGEKISVEINNKRTTRSDGKRAFYPDQRLPESLDPTKYNVNSISVFRCRKCWDPVDETVNAAKFETK